MKYLFGQPTEDGQMQHEDGSYIIKTATGEVVPFASLEELQANVDEARKAKVRAKYAELQKQDEAGTDNGQSEAEAETSAMPLEDVEVVENYNVDDEVGLEVDGVSINGVVQDYIPEDDTLIIDLDRPINGKYTIAITPEELASMAVSHNGRELERREPQQSEKDAGGGLFAAPLSEQEAYDLVTDMELNAEPAPELELTAENWDKEFGEDGMVDTPIGKVKMGENQFLKLLKKKRNSYFGMIKPTLVNPDMVLEENDPQDGAERDTKYLFVKTFVKPDGSRYVHFESVTVQKDNLEVSISSHEIGVNALIKKVHQDKLIHLNEKFFNSDGRLIEPQKEGSDLVPTPTSSEDKGTTTSQNGNGSNEEIAQTEQHSAVSMLPHDIDGNPIYEQGEPAVAFDAITEQCEGNVEVAMSVAESMLADKVKALKAVEKAKSKGGETVAEKIAAEKERMAAIEQAKKDVEAWQAIVEAGKIRQAAQAMGSRQAAVAPEVVADGTLNGVPDVIDDTPQEARARGYRRVNGHKVERQEPVAHSTGREVEVKFSNDKTVKGRAVLIEADELQPSHQGGQRNPVHFIDEAQPKERVDNASRAALNRMAAHIRPEEITSSVTAYTGAPTVNARGEVIQGNNRSGALKAMYAQHKDQAEKYKQYLLDNAERLGLDRAEIEAMKNPVLVNMVDVSDEEAVNLGQYEAKDTESGGVERIKPKNTVQKMGTDIGTFFNTLFASNEEDLSLAELIDKNGAEVLAYLNRKGYITDTQYKSAFDSKGNLTAEAKNDLRGIVVSHIFQNGNSRLEEMFNAMPAKAQKAILATAYRDNASPESERMMTEIQNSVRAFNALMQYDEFANARNYEAARKAVENWAKQYQYDDATGESYLPAEKFSNFALVLAAMYKGRTQKFIQDSFTDMYDLIQGTRKGDLFGTPDNTPRTLAQAIKEVLNIDYNENRNGQAGNNGVGIDTQKSERGRRGSNGDVGGGKHSKGTEPQTDSGGRVGGDSQGNGEIVESQSFLDVVRTLYSKGKEVASKLFQRSFFDIAQTPRFMQELGLRGDKFTIKYGVIARHISKDNSHSLSEQVWEQLPKALQNPFAISRITDRENSYRIYTTLETENGEYVVVGVDVKNAGREIEVNAISTVFGRRNNANLSKNEEVIYRSKKITPEQSSLLERPNFVQYPTGQELSDDKGTTKTGNGDELGEKIAQAEAEVDTTYTIEPAQYTTKRGKVLDMHLVKFADTLSKEQYRAAKELAKAERGWYDAKQGGFMMRSEESAKQLAETVVGNKEAVADAQPVSLADINKVTEQQPQAGETEEDDIFSQAERIAAEVDKERLAKQKEKDEKKSNPSGNKLVTDERYAELRERLRKKLNNLNVGIDPEILSIGIEMAVYHLEKGSRKFADYATAMIADLGDVVRPYLKAFYNGARDLPEVESSDFATDLTPYNEVQEFDIATFGKEHNEPMTTAEVVVAEQAHQEEAEQAKQEIISQRNSERKANEGYNGFKRGDKVLFTPQGRNKKTVEATIYDFEDDEDHNPILDTGLAPVIYEVVEWSDIKPVENKTKSGEKQSKKKSLPLQQTGELSLSDGSIKHNEDGLQRDDAALRSERLSADSDRNAGAGSRTGNLQEVQQDTGRVDRRGENGNGRAGSGKTQSDGVFVRPLQQLEGKNSRNNHSERGKDHAPTSVDARIEANFKAVELAKQLLESGEEATEEQKEVLRKFSGWGGLGKVFDEHANYSHDGRFYYNEPTLENKRLRELLSEEEYQQALMSANSAYYTPAYVIDTLWDIAEQMGFKGGNILEGSAGIGNILGQMPASISANSDIQAVEIDGISGAILSLLYPDAKVEIQGFEQTRVPNGSVDLAVTNVPFVTGLRVNDTTGDNDLSKKFHNIHDFCIAKNVRKLREGGLGIFITSSGTLDNSRKLRDWVVNEGEADFVGAFRMNNKTFGGTGVTSDIIVIRKRVNGQKSAQAIDVSTVTGERVAEYDTGKKRKVKGQYEPVVKNLSMDYNKYFMEHPERMAGEMRFGFEEGDRYRPTSKGLYPKQGTNQKELLSEFVKSFTQEEVGERSTEEKKNDEVAPDKKVGEMFVKDGKLYINSISNARLLDVNSNKVKGHTKAECFEAYSAIKKALADVLAYQTENESDDGLKPLLDKLNKAYDDFEETYGYFNKNTAIAFLRNDVDYANVSSVETYKEQGNGKGGVNKIFGKADVMDKRVVEKVKEPNPTNVKEGIVASVFKFGHVDVPYIAERLGRSIDDVKNEIIENGYGFEDPVTRKVEASYQYLSGNVREKLSQAEANNENGEFDRNIKALQEKIPMDIPAHLIDFTLGSSWIDPELYDEYVKERTDVDARFTLVGGTWFMKEPSSTDYEKNRAMGVKSEVLNSTTMGHELIEAAIQNKTITVSATRKNLDGTSETITDKDATQACANKIDEIRQDFKDWAKQKMQSDPDMSAKMERVYNDTFNNFVPISIPDEFAPEHFAGANPRYTMRPHQSRAIVRGTQQSVLLAHEVGTGKTFTLISTAMEMRRLGTARKPMIVVQNATVGQFVADAKELYPNAKILTLEDNDRNVEGRKNFYAKIRYNDWDMIIVPQSVFERIPDSEDRQYQYIKEKIDEKVTSILQMKEQDPYGDSLIVKQVEREVERLEEELAELSSVAVKKNTAAEEKKRAVAKQNAEVRAMEMLDRRTDDVENFDDMGIDALLVDEAHEYKHLGFATAMQRGVKGVDPSYSKKSQGVFLKAQAVMEKNNGRNVVFATGTPISNTAAEIWTFMRYLMPADTMKEYGIYYFDDFVRNFGNIQQMLEFTTSGKFKENNRFAGYVNLPELVRIWSGVSDTVLTEEAPEVMEKIPELEGGKAQDIYLPQTRALRSVMKFVKSELERFDNMSGKEKKANSHIPLTMYGIAKAAAVDARLVQADAEDDPNSKTNEAVRQTLRSLKETADYSGTVAIFADNYQNKASGFNLYEDIRAKLIAEGVSADEIVVIKSGMTDKKKAAIFDKFNHGEVRVLLGSTFTLGTGVNIQERLHTLIHLDAPNRPMDYTQRNGRILRQGNIHKEMGKPVRVLRFGVEDSLDVTAYQRLKTKGAIADSIMRGRQMMENSMVNRVLEEEEDVFGDTIAQLSGSEYAMLKNNAEKNMRKYASRKKQYEADQTYIHNAKPKLKGLIKEAEQRIEDNGSYLKAVQSAFPNGRFGEISVGKQRFASVEAMEDFFKDYNKKALADMQKIKSGEITGDQRRELTIRIGDFDFVVTTDLSRKTASEGRTLFTQTERKMTYSCPELGIENTPVKQNLLRNAVEDITTNVLTGKDFSEQLEAAQRSKRHNEAELEQMLSREGKPFEYEKELKQAQAQYEEYSELMKKELEEKEAKYADMDASVETANGITSTEENEEENDGDTLYRSDETNERFNEELERYSNGNMGKNEMFHLGNPRGVIRMFLPDLPIVMRQRVVTKGAEKKHDVEISALSDMPQQIAHPIFVFKKDTDTTGILTEMKDRNGRNVFVAFDIADTIQVGGNYLEVNNVLTVHGRRIGNIVKPIIENNSLQWVDKKKALKWFSSASPDVQQEITIQELSDAAKIVKDFENPTNTDDIRFRGSDRFFNGISADDLFDLLSEYSSYSFGAYELIDSLEKYYGGELISASSGAKHAIERGFVPKPGHKYSGLDGEYHHIEFQDENGDTFVEAVPFIEAKNVESDLGIKFGKEDKNRVPLTKEEKVLRDAVIDRIRRSGIEVIDAPAVGQRVLDMANGNAKEQAKKKRALETASLRATPRSLTVISSADGAKILQNIEELAKELTESVSQPKTFVGKVAQALGATQDGSKSEYATFETKNGKVVTIRLADHNAKVSNFDRRNELSGISIVVSPKVNAGITNDGDAHIVEYYYDAIKLRKAEGKPLAEIVRSIQQALYSGEFKDTTGLAERQEVNADNLREHRVYHGSGAEFEAFDHSHMGEGEGQQAYGWGTYVTEVDDIGKYYAKTSFLIAEEKRRSSRKATPVSMAVGAIIHQENYNLQAVSFEQRKEAAIADLETKIKIDENVLRNEKEDETMTACKSLPTRECGWKRFTISIIAVR